MDWQEVKARYNAGEITEIVISSDVPKYEREALMAEFPDAIFHIESVAPRGFWGNFLNWKSVPWWASGLILLGIGRCFSGGIGG